MTTKSIVLLLWGNKLLPSSCLQQEQDVLLHSQGRFCPCFKYFKYTLMTTLLKTCKCSTPQYLLLWKIWVNYFPPLVAWRHQVHCAMGCRNVLMCRKTCGHTERQAAAAHLSERRQVKVRSGAGGGCAGLVLLRRWKSELMWFQSYNLSLSWDVSMYFRPTRDGKGSKVSVLLHRAAQ